MFPTYSCKHRRCLFDVIISPMVWVIHRRCSRTALRRIGYAMAMLSPVCSIFYRLVIRQQNKRDLFFYMHQRIFDNISAILPQISIQRVCVVSFAQTFDIDTDRHQNTSFSSPKIVDLVGLYSMHKAKKIYMFVSDLLSF